METSRRRDLILMALILLLAVALRVPGLGRAGFWHDELLTLDVVRGPFSSVVERVVETENMPPGYYLVLNRWVAAFGPSEFSLRLPSAISGVAAVGVVSVFVARLFGRGAGNVAGLLLAVNPYHVMYSMEARAYALMFLLAAVSCYLFLGGNREQNGRWMVLYAVVSAAMLWVHPMSGFLLVAQNLCVVIAKIWFPDWTRLSVRNWIAAQGAIACMFGPWMPRFLDVGRAGQPWMTYVPLHESLLTHARSVAILALWLALAGVAIWKARRERNLASVVLALLLWLIPILLPTLLSTARKPIFTPRYGIAGLIGVTALAGYAATSLGRVGGSMAAGGLVVLSVLALGNPLAPVSLNPHPQLHQAARDVAGRAVAGDGLFCTSPDPVRAFTHYYNGPPLERIHTLPGERPPGRVWVIAQPGAEPAPGGTLKLTHRWSYGGIDVLQLVRSD